MLWFPGLEPEEDVWKGGGLLRVHGARVDASGILGGKHPRETKRWKVKQHFLKLWNHFLLKVSSRSQTMEGVKPNDHYYTFSSLSLKRSSTNSWLVNTLTGESLLQYWSNSDDGGRVWENTDNPSASWNNTRLAHVDFLWHSKSSIDSSLVLTKDWQDWDEKVEIMKIPGGAICRSLGVPSEYHICIFWRY